MAIDLSLSAVVTSFAAKALQSGDSGLERTWKWGDYDEGVRFAFFRVMEELGSLAVKVADRRARNGQPPSQARRIMAQYHAAYRDLQVVFLGVDEELVGKVPTEGEWNARQCLSHLVEAEAGFFAAITFALENHRAGTWRSDEAAFPSFWRILGMEEAQFGAALDGTLAERQDFHARLHERVLNELGKITDEELELPGVFWESERFPLRFRLHRFESHLRQHTIQVEKTLAALNFTPTETQRLLRLIYAALAEVEGAALGLEDTGPEWAETTRLIQAITGEVFS